MPYFSPNVPLFPHIDWQQQVNRPAPTNDATVRYLMNGQGMDPFTPHTIVDLATLTEELERIRQWGYAIENGEYKIGLRSVSAPVFDREGQMRYTLTVVGLFRHVASGEFEEAVDMVCAAAGSLSRELGYHA